jgi:hypothetical protein
MYIKGLIVELTNAINSHAARILYNKAHISWDAIISVVNKNAVGIAAHTNGR